MADAIEFPVNTPLSNGVQVPSIGLGTFRIESQAEMDEVIEAAYASGYRHIDTAAYYDNEQLIRMALKKGSIKREQLFLTSKVWVEDNGYEATLASFRQSLKRLGTTYLDLYLIHWPNEATMETWMALERLYAEGKVRAIGVSNFTELELKQIVESNHIKPMINQIEVHPGLSREGLVRYCRRHQIAVTASAPLGRGEILDNPTITEIAEQLGKTPAQVVLRWHIQRDIIPIPKSSRVDRIRENIGCLDFRLDSNQMHRIDHVAGSALFSHPQQEAVE
jgi:diketogulonate reductase-like aldo/keto reductase